MRHGFGVHSSLWGPNWTPELAAHAIDEATRHKLDILEIALLDPASVDAEHTRTLFGNTGITPVCSLTLPAEVRASRAHERASSAIASGRPGTGTMCGTTAPVRSSTRSTPRPT